MKGKEFENAGAMFSTKLEYFMSKLCFLLEEFFIPILHFYAYVTMFYRLVRTVAKLVHANSPLLRSTHVSTQKGNANLYYFTFNQSIKLNFLLNRDCFAWIANCTPRLLPQHHVTLGLSKRHGRNVYGPSTDRGNFSHLTATTRSLLRIQELNIAAKKFCYHKLCFSIFY